jgi:hypothetical protein
LRFLQDKIKNIQYFFTITNKNNGNIYEIRKDYNINNFQINQRHDLNFNDYDLNNNNIFFNFPTK